MAHGCPPETTQLEFRKTYCIGCMGEDIPEGLLAKIGTPRVVGGPHNKKRIVVSPLLETRQENIYLAGDVLSPAYFETTSIDDPGTFKETKRRGNIKAAMREGVLIAEVIDQKLAGKTLIKVHLEFEEGDQPVLVLLSQHRARQAEPVPVEGERPVEVAHRQRQHLDPRFHAPLPSLRPCWRKPPRPSRTNWTAARACIRAGISSENSSRRSSAML